MKGFDWVLRSGEDRLVFGEEVLGVRSLGRDGEWGLRVVGGLNFMLYEFG